jgi:hypothetical protein
VKNITSSLQLKLCMFVALNLQQAIFLYQLESRYFYIDQFCKKFVDPLVFIRK